MTRALVAFALVFSVLTLSGCGWFDKQVTSFGGSSERCYKNVLYVNFTTGATPVYTRGPNGEPLLTAC
jgi:hypothetical protein